MNHVLNSNKAVLPIFAAFFLILITCAFTVFFAYQFGHMKPAKSLSQTNRDYHLNQFNVNDAISACREEAASKFGSQLQDAVVNDHSTRFDQDRAIYLVVLDALIGSRDKQIKNLIYCHVNPNHYTVDYFKAHGDKYRDFSFGFFD